MSFDMVSYVAGIATLAAAQYLTYHIVRIIELRTKELEQWNQVRSQSSVSEDYWRQQTTEAPPTYDVEGSIVTRPASPTLPGF